MFSVHEINRDRQNSLVAGSIPPDLPALRARAGALSTFRSDHPRRYVQSAIPFLELAWQGRTDWRVHMQVLALISLYAPVVITILAVVAVLFSFFWLFLPEPHWMSNAMGLLIRFWRWRERHRRGQEAANGLVVERTGCTPCSFPSR